VSNSSGTPALDRTSRTDGRRNTWWTDCHSLAGHAERAYRNVVLRDPEGNEFCLGGGHFSATAS
jgi:hypothetical protein